MLIYLLTRLLIMMHVKVPYRNCTHNRLPEDEPSGSKHGKDTKIKIYIYINLGNVHFVVLYCIFF